MADPKAEQVVDAVRSTLEDITGDYRPDQVLPVPAFHAGVLDSSVDTIFSVSPGPMEEYRHAFGTTNNMMVDLSVGLALCKRFNRLDPVGTSEKQRWDIQVALLRAAGDAIRTDRQLGGVALDLIISDIDLSADDTYIEGWAVAFMRVIVTYLHSESSS